MIYLNKVKETIRRIKCLISKKYSSKYYTQKYKRELGICHENVIFKGKIFFTDPRNIVIGKNVSIGKNCQFYSEGGIYIEDDSNIEENVTIRTYANTVQFGKLNSKYLGQLNPVIIGKGNRIHKNSIVQNSIKSSDKNGSANIRKPDFFVVSTGRSGTKALATHLERNENISCRHEAKFIFNRLSTELAHGFKSEKQVIEELESIYNQITINYTDKKIYGECDLKNSNLIPLLHQIMPKAKFIWLIRRADTFVASAFGRRWFDEYEYSFPHPQKSPDTSENLKIFDHYRMEYARYRVNGFLSGCFSEREWTAMTCFERCCWYWRWWNEKIESDLSQLPDSFSFMLKLEELESKQYELFKFLNSVDSVNEFKKVNAAYHETVSRESWTEEQLKLYEKWCGLSMKKWYND